ncbi:MAG: hypothetical protein A2103_00310 [Gammaproteobacteria bacterium GWF2_41_13]|nr:MAG: hypothetical protein A2103_00310 [Gammaproteobacteria bacterium GWF2_41_13]
MLVIYDKSFWYTFGRGIIAVLFGLFALFYPHLTFSILVVIFGIYVFASGGLTILLALFSREYDTGWWTSLIEGFFSMLAGILVFTWPTVTEHFLIYVIAVWAMITGIVQLIAYIQLHRTFDQGFLLGAGGVLSLVAGVFLLGFPASAIIMLAWFIGFYALVFGLLSLFSAFQQK